MLHVNFGVDSKFFQIEELVYNRPVVLSANVRRLKTVVRGDGVAIAHIGLEEGE